MLGAASTAGTRKHIVWQDVALLPTHATRGGPRGFHCLNDEVQTPMAGADEVGLSFLDRDLSRTRVVASDSKIMPIPDPFPPIFRSPHDSSLCNEMTYLSPKGNKTLCRQASERNLLFEEESTQ